MQRKKKNREYWRMSRVNDSSRDSGSIQNAATRNSGAHDAYIGAGVDALRATLGLKTIFRNWRVAGETPASKAILATQTGYSLNDSGLGAIGL